MLLDLTLPDADGLDVCRWIRDSDERLPIVMLTARAEETDIVIGLDAGADDYITKPFRLAELMARLRVRLRLATPRVPNRARRTGRPRGASRVEGRRGARSHAQRVRSPHAVDHRCRAASCRGKRIMHDVWDEFYYGSTRTLDMHISSLRKKLGDDPTSPRRITTVRGVGFRFELD